MSCSDITARIGETRTIEDVTILFNGVLFDHASVNITTPWGATYTKTIGLGNTITIENTPTEYVNIKFSTYSGDLANFNVCYEKGIELGSMLCESNPAGAQVYYKSQYIEQYTYMGKTPIWIEEIPPGTRYIEMKLSGYRDHEDSYTIESGKITGIDINLEPIITTGTLSCNTSPTGAKIYLNNVYQGLTNKTIPNLTPGTYTVKYTKDGYEDYTKTMTINAGQISYLTKYLLTAPEPTGTISCTSNPSGAEIWIDGSNTGEVTPRAFINMLVKRHEVKFIKADYYEYSDIFDVKENEITNVFATLISSVEEPEELIGEYIGEISHEIVSIDEINFEISVKNISSIDGYFYVDLRNEAGIFLQKAPKITEAISAGQTTTIHMSSVLSTFPSWSVEDVENQTITFELKTSDSFGFGKEIVDSVTYKVEVEPEEPSKCIEYTTQTECEVNGCYWHTDNTCQEMPEGATDYFDVHIKPYSWYNGKYEEVVSKALTLMTDLTGAMSNYISSITGYEYKGVEIREDINKQLIVVRIFLRDTNETSLIHPAIIAGALIVIAAIMLAIGFIVGTSEGDFSKSEITQLAKDIIINAEIDAYEHAYDIDKTTAIKLINCLKTIETCDDSLTCFENNNVTPSLSNQMEVLVAYETSIDSVYTGVADTIEDAEFEAFATKTLAELEIVIEKLESATITPEGAACTTIDIIDDTIEDLDEKKEEQEDEECAFEIAGKCIITKKAAKTLTIAAVGIGGLMALSAVKGITKK